MQTYKIPNIPNKKVILALGAESAGNFSLWENGTLHFSQDFGDLANEQNFSSFKAQLLKFLKDQKTKPDIILSDLHPLFETTKLAQQLAKKYKAKYLPIQHHLAHIFSAIGEQIIEHETWGMEQRLSNNTQNTNPTGLCEEVILRSNPDRCQALDRHEFSSTKILAKTDNKTNTIFGIACDGTGLGTDGKIWGGEAFAISNFQFPCLPAYRTGRPDRQAISNENTNSNKIQIQRVGHLENQVLLGGEMAIREPARFIIAMINKCQMSNVKFPIKSQFSNVKNKKQLAYEIVKKYYTQNEFEVLWNQLEQNFNCLETSSTARVLDAVSVLLGFSKNESLSKHGPIALLEKNSTNPYNNLNPKIERYLSTCLPDRQAGQAGKTQETCLPAYRTGKPDRQAKTKQNSNFKIQTPSEMLFSNTTYLFEYLIKNLHRDKARLAATAQKYLADGLTEIVKLSNQSTVISHQRMEDFNNHLSVKDQQNTGCQLPITDYRLPITALFASGGMTSNKIISKTLEKQGFYLNQKIPRGDAGISFGQIMFYLLTK